MGVCESQNSNQSNTDIENVYFPTETIKENIFNKYKNKAFEGQQQQSNNGSIIFTTRISDKNSLDPKMYIIKEIRKNQQNQKDENQFKEFNFRQQLEHPNILCPNEIFETENFIHLLQDKPKGTILSQIIRDGVLNQDIVSIQDIIQQLLSLVVYLNGFGLFIRNLNPDILLYNIQTGKIQLLDLGPCEYQPTKKRIKTNILTSAPEMLTENLEQGKETDIWSIGIIFFLLLQSESPQYIDSDDNYETLLLQKARHGNIVNFDKLMIKKDKFIVDQLFKFLIKIPQNRTCTQDLIKDKDILCIMNQKKDFALQKDIMHNMINTSKQDLFSNQLGVYFHMFDSNLQYLQRTIDIEKNGQINIQLLKEKFDTVLSNLNKHEDSQQIIDKILKMIDNQNSSIISSEDFQILNFELFFNSSQFLQFEDKLKNLSVLKTDKIEIPFENFLEVMEITSPLVLHKMDKYLKQSEFQNESNNSIIFDTFIRNLLKNTSYLSTQKSTNWQIKLGCARGFNTRLKFNNNNETFIQAFIKNNVINHIKKQIDSDYKKIRLNLSENYGKDHNEYMKNNNFPNKINNQEVINILIDGEQNFDSMNEDEQKKNKSQLFKSKTKSIKMKITQKDTTKFISEIVSQNHNQIQYNYFDDIEVSIDEINL